MANALKQLQSQKQKLAPRQVLHAKLLQLNTANLEQVILSELEKNPLLEQIEPIDAQQPNDELTDEIPLNDIDAPLEDMYTNESTYYFSEEKKEIPVPEQSTLLDELINQLRFLDLNSEELEIAEEILWNTNERGYLDTDLVLIADRFNLLEEEVEPILFKVQRLEPKGIASRDLQECLLIQLEHDQRSLPYNIIQNVYNDFMQKRYEKIKANLGCSDLELHDAVEHISHLNPRPGEGYRDKFQTVIPDIIARLDGEDWVITTNDMGIPELRINAEYSKQMIREKLKPEEKKFFKDKFNSAQWFIGAINQRRTTMTNVMASIIEFQPEWFNGDMDYLRPLKLQDIADRINVDISTVSRSTRGKFVDTPYGIFEIKHFFTDSIQLSDGRVLGTYVIKKALKRIICMEDKRAPLNDDSLVEVLRENGFDLARRTVAKYRDQMGYPVARLRKKI